MSVAQFSSARVPHILCLSRILLQGPILSFSCSCVRYGLSMVVGQHCLQQLDKCVVLNTSTLLPLHLVSFWPWWSRVFHHGSYC